MLLRLEKPCAGSNACVATLAEQGCAPTFPTPGILVERYPDFIRHLQDKGAEIAVHGYQHVNLNAFPLEEARRQLERAARAFERLGIQVHGFRSPYIGCCDALIDTLPAGLFSYSSNKAIRWRTLNNNPSHASGFYTTLDKFYQALNSAETVCVPWHRSTWWRSRFASRMTCSSWMAYAGHRRPRPGLAADAPADIPAGRAIHPAVPH